MLIFNEIHKKEAKFTWIYAILNLRALSEIESHQEPGMQRQVLDGRVEGHALTPSFENTGITTNC